MYLRSHRLRCRQAPPVNKDNARTFGRKNPAFEQEKRGAIPGVQETSTSKVEEQLYDEIPGERSIHEQYQIPRNVPVFKRHQKTPKSADGCKDNDHYMALINYKVLKKDPYQKPKDIGGPRHDYENFGNLYDQSEV